MGYRDFLICVIREIDKSRCIGDFCTVTIISFFIITKDALKLFSADGYKDILSITVGTNETSKFWLRMLNDLKNRGVQDVLFSVLTDL